MAYSNSNQISKLRRSLFTILFYRYSQSVKIFKDIYIYIYGAIKQDVALHPGSDIKTNIIFSSLSTPETVVSDGVVMKECWQAVPNMWPGKLWSPNVM